jgi:hypothetical protein
VSLNAEDKQSRAIRAVIMVVVVLILIVAGSIWMVARALAHENPTDWIGQEKRKNAAGILCCGKGDCFPFRVDQIKVRSDGYHFPDGRVAAFVAAAPSVDGFYWRCEWGGEVRCIFAPVGGS